MQLKKPLIAIIFILFFISCKKASNENNPSGNTTVETGVYIGKLDNFNSRQTVNQFNIQLNKIDENNYKVSQIDIGGVPEIMMEVKSNTSGSVFFRIPTQTYQGKTFSGTGGVSGGFDAVYFSSLKSIYFGIAYTDTPNMTIMFNGNKK